MGASHNSTITVLNGDDVEGYTNLVGRAIRAQMTKMIEADHPFKDIVDPQTVFAFVRDISKVNGLRVFLKDGKPIGALGFSYEELWWAKKGKTKVLLEHFVVSLNPDFHGFGRIAVKFLESTAKSKVCSLIMSGNLLGTQPKQTENLYMQKACFQFSYKHFLKVL